MPPTPGEILSPLPSHPWGGAQPCASLVPPTLGRCPALCPHPWGRCPALCLPIPQEQSAQPSPARTLLAPAWQLMVLSHPGPLLSSVHPGSRSQVLTILEELPTPLPQARSITFCPWATGPSFPQLVITALKCHKYDKNIQVTGSAALFYLTNSEYRSEQSVRLRRQVIQVVLNGMESYQEVTVSPSPAPSTLAPRTQPSCSPLSLATPASATPFRRGLQPLGPSKIHNVQEPFC